MKLPYNTDAENNYLSACLLDNRVLVEHPLTPADFYGVSNRLVFEAMMKLAAAGTPIDIVTLCDSMQKDGTIEKAGGLMGVTSLNDLAPTAKNAGYYAAIIDGYSRRRQLVKAAAEIQDAAEKDGAIEDVLEKAQREITRIVLRGQDEEPDAIQMMVDFSQWVEGRFRDGGADVIKTGNCDLDRLINGFSPGQLIIIAARPSMGKTSMALNFMVEALKVGRGVTLYSLETARNEILSRMVAIYEGIRLEAILKPQILTDDEMARVIKAQEEMTRWRMKISDRTFSLPSILQKIRRDAVNGCDMAIIDHLQLIGGEKKENRTQEISDISRKLKLLALDLKIPIICLSQLSRAVESRSDKRPLMSDLREGGSIEQDADIVMTIYRPGYYTHENDDIAELAIVKQREGPQGMVKCHFNGAVQRFSPVDWQNGDAYGDKVQEDDVAI